MCWILQVKKKKGKVNSFWSVWANPFCTTVWVTHSCETSASIYQHDFSDTLACDILNWLFWGMKVVNLNLFTDCLCHGLYQIGSVRVICSRAALDQCDRTASNDESNIIKPCKPANCRKSPVPQRYLLRMRNSGRQGTPPGVSEAPRWLCMEKARGQPGVLTGEHQHEVKIQALF